MAVSNLGLSHFTLQREWTTLYPHREYDLQKSHFWPSALNSLNGKVVKSCGMWEGAMLVLGSCVLCLMNVPERLRILTQRVFWKIVGPLNIPDHFIFLTWYPFSFNQVSENEKAWRSWFDKEAPENEPFVSDIYNTFDIFKRFLLIRSTSYFRFIFRLLTRSWTICLISFV